MSNDTVRQTWRKPIEAPASIPERADVVIIGGGIVGVSAAWFLAKSGNSVALCEKGHIAGEQSGRNWGWVRQQGRDVRELPMMIDSIRIWDGLAQSIGEDVGFTRGGCLFAARSEKELAGYESWLDAAHEFGLDTRIIRGAEFAEQVHGVATDWTGAMYTASDGRAEPHKAAPAIARDAARHGAHVLTGCAVRGLDLEGGRVAGVVTEHGTIRTQTVLCAGGAWTSLFCRSLGVTVPQLKVRGTVARTAPGPDVLEGNLFDRDFGIRRRADGGYTIGPGSLLDHPVTPSSFRFFFKFLRTLMQEFRIIRLTVGREFIDEWRTPKTWPLDEPTPFETTRVLDPAPDRKAIARLERDVGDVFPQLAGIEIVESWAGVIESSPDAVPIIDAAETVPGLHVATGFSGHGFGIGPGAGRAIAAMLTGGDSEVDLAPFRLSRFFDGTPIRPQAKI